MRVVPSGTVELEPESHGQEDAHLLAAYGGPGAIRASAATGDDGPSRQLLDVPAEGAGWGDVRIHRHAARGRHARGAFQRLQHEDRHLLARARRRWAIARG